MHPRSSVHRVALAVLLAGAFAGSAARAQDQVAVSPCGSLKNSFGPFDYRTASHTDKELVESFHYGPQVDALITGMTGPLGSDISYTLIVFPNHHRALIAMTRLGEREKRPQAVGAKYSVECYFERALRFRSDDTVARMLYAQFLLGSHREADARAQLEETRRIGAENPYTQYNLGMIYFDMKDYDKALKQAHTAIAMGFAPPALEQRLRSAGHWRDPSPVAAPADAASGAGAAVDATVAPTAALSAASAVR